MTKFSKDDNPAVKKELCGILKDLVTYITFDHYIDIINTLISDSNDIVRIPILSHWKQI